MRCVLRAATAAILLATLAGGRPAAGGERYYTVSDLGTLGGQMSRALALNDAGDVVGEAMDATARYRAFRWIGGSGGGALLDLGTLPGGDQLQATTISSAGAINAAGEITGYSVVHTAAQFQTHAFLWRNGVMMDLGAPPAGGSWGAALNAAGQVAGWRADAWGDTRAFVQDAQTVVLPTLDGRETRALAINAGGDVVGWSLVGDLRHAFLYRGGVLTDLGTLGDGGCRGRCLAPESEAAALNAAGDVVGSAVVGNPTHAFLWRAGVMTDLHDPSADWSRGLGINYQGEIVGALGFRGEPLEHGFLARDGMVRDLNALVLPGSGWIIGPARAINAAGQIAGSGWKDGSGWERAYLLEPHEAACGNGVPEPGEACDDGNAVAADGCETDCTVTDRCGNGVVDTGEECDGDADACCTAECRRADADGDGICDLLDPCTATGGAIQKPRLVLAPTGSPEASLRARFSGTLVMPRGAVVDPAASGLRLVLTAAPGDAVLDGTAPPGAGWTRRGKSWKWQGGGAPLTRVTLKGAGRGKLRFQVDGLVAADAAPTRAALALDAAAGTDRCADVSLGTGCSESQRGRTRRCGGRRPH